MSLISIRNLVKKYEENYVLAGIDLDIESGEVKVIMGPSGCGKTTLVMCLNRLVEPDSGDIYIHGENIMAPGVDIQQLRKKFGFVFQSFALYRHLTVRENITLGLRKLCGMSRQQASERAMHELARFEMAVHAEKLPKQLSGGQKQRVALARALSMDPEILIFDEPTSALDPIMTREVASLINRLHGGVTLVCVTHDVLLAEQISDKVTFLDKGMVRAQGSIQALKQQQQESIRDFFGRYGNV
ncbi:amino acid ABC transporter ATP-binding protein [Edwardsiella ictaluri]|uniref:amino acid ABC transporter ATP-binding protein n=1 Tax=Edwardsiella ictaluri TaxID=67780 RepID=UPI0009BF0633|nr:amino acid ABC transporter ATP-binding protein [Edwardsiella ictaluri]ARD39687.1 amino acid ABC transporter ATP-binding protein [Edwardsiella ictaluri]QPW28132.1 amino acid ABC transporter ATP-binding protein [Edwardsiella ictaluri]